MFDFGFIKMEKLLITLSFLFVFFGCYSQNKSKNQNPLRIFKQSEIPSDMSGCGGSFFLSIADSKSLRFIGVNDGAKYAVFKINGKLERLNQVKYITRGDNKGWTSIYKSQDKSINLIIQVKTQKAADDEDTFITGIITVDINGKKSNVPFVGDFGC